MATPPVVPPRANVNAPVENWTVFPVVTVWLGVTSPHMMMFPADVVDVSCTVNAFTDAVEAAAVVTVITTLLLNDDGLVELANVHVAVVFTSVVWKLSPRRPVVPNATASVSVVWYRFRNRSVETPAGAAVAF